MDEYAGHLITKWRSSSISLK